MANGFKNNEMMALDYSKTSEVAEKRSLTLDQMICGVPKKEQRMIGSSTLINLVVNI